MWFIDSVWDWMLYSFGLKHFIERFLYLSTTILTDWIASDWKFHKESNNRLIWNYYRLYISLTWDKNLLKFWLSNWLPEKKETRESFVSRMGETRKKLTWYHNILKPKTILCHYCYARLTQLQTDFRFKLYRFGQYDVLLTHTYIRLSTRKVSDFIRKQHFLLNNSSDRASYSTL